MENFNLIRNYGNQIWNRISVFLIKIIFQVLPTEIGYRTLKILIQYMYSGEATVTNDQLEGVLKAGDILRVRGLWRSNTGGSKKENIQSNNQKVDRDKKEQAPITGLIQKIKLIQPSEKPQVETVPQVAIPQPNLNSSNSVSTPKVVEKKVIQREELEEDKIDEVDEKILLDDPKNVEQIKNKENVEAVAKKRKSVTNTESSKSKSESGDTVRIYKTQ